MYDNIGRKLKDLAHFIFIIEAVAAVISGLVLISSGEDAAIIYGLLVMILGPVAAWISSWLLYAFGQLVENSDIIAAEYNAKNEKREKAIEKREERKQAQINKAAKAAVENPEFLDTEFVDITCPNCKATLTYPKWQLQSEEGVICPMCDAHISM